MRALLLGASAAALAAAYLLYRRSKPTAPTVLASEAPKIAASPIAAAVDAPAPPPAPPPAPAPAPAPSTSEPDARRGLHVLHSGGFAAEIAETLASRVGGRTTITGMDKFREWQKAVSLSDGDAAWPPLRVVFVVQTIENEQPPEDAGPCVRFFNRRTHPADMLQGRVRFAVLGLGDSNLLLDRQTTTAKDCNQVAQKLDRRLVELSAERMMAIGLTDDRTGNQELEPWLRAACAALA